MRPILFTAVFLLLGLSSTPPAAVASKQTLWPDVPSRLEFDTPYGVLQIKDNEYVYESRLYIDETNIDPVIEGLLNIPYAFSLPKSQVALVSINSGDTECPISYRWVVLDSKGYTVSSPFGSCSEQIKVTVQGNSFIVQTPSHQTPDKIDVYAYDGKTVRKRTNP